MGEHTAIHWTHSTWNPWVGCRKVSAGCKHCYMFRDMKKYGKDPTDIHRTTKPVFTAPLRYEEPRLIFTCSWSDFFIEQADEWRAEAWEIIRNTPHTYQILTKRPERIAACLPSDWGDGYPNVWLGVSIEDRNAYGRLPKLRSVPVKVRFLSCEPLLESIPNMNLTGIHWVITGGESGPGCRPMDLDWARDIRDQCQRHGVPFFFKQVGGTRKVDGVWGGDELDGQRYQAFPAYLPPKVGALPLKQLEMFG